MTAATDREAWEKAWQGLGVAAPPKLEYDKLIAAYTEPHRAYHTRQHLEECLTRLREVRGMCSHPDEVELALWYHDAIYAPRRSDNETRSADWLVKIANQISVPVTVIGRMRELVLATRHDAIPAGIDAQILVDIDLSILGASAQRFDEYERQVRKEYRWVPLLLYRSQRARILESFVKRPRIYSTEFHFNMLESKAHENITRSLGQLRQRKQVTRL